MVASCPSGTHAPGGGALRTPIGVGWAQLVDGRQVRKAPVVAKGRMAARRPRGRPAWRGDRSGWRLAAPALSALAGSRLGACMRDKVRGSLARRAARVRLRDWPQRRGCTRGLAEAARVPAFSCTMAPPSACSPEGNRPCGGQRPHGAARIRRASRAHRPAPLQGGGRVATGAAGRCDGLGLDDSHAWQQGVVATVPYGVR